MPNTEEKSTHTTQEFLAIVAQAEEQYATYLEVARLGEFSAAVLAEQTWVHDPSVPLSFHLCASE